MYDFERWDYCIPCRRVDFTLPLTEGLVVVDDGHKRTLDAGRVHTCEHVCREVDFFHDEVDPRNPNNPFKVTITDEMREISKYWCRALPFTDRPPVALAFNWLTLYPCRPDAFYNGNPDKK